MEALLAVSASVVWGQAYEPRRPAYPVDCGYRGYYAGTYEGSVFYGLGQFARGLGEGNYYNALAARESQEARALAIANHQMAVTNWLNRRNAHRERVRAERMGPEQIARVAKANQPDRLTVAQFEPATGKLTWPAALMGEEFAKARAAVEQAFAERTSRDAGGQSQFYVLIRQITEEMLAALATKLPEMSPMEYMAGRNFLVGLKYEALAPAAATAPAIAE
jgi:hypothetical protein